MCMYVCMSVHVCPCGCACACMCLRMYMRMYVCACVCMCMRMYVCVCFCFSLRDYPLPPLGTSGDRVVLPGLSFRTQLRENKQENVLINTQTEVEYYVFLFVNLIVTFTSVYIIVFISAREQGSNIMCSFLFIEIPGNNQR